jgi:hypothetical protein
MSDADGAFEPIVNRLVKAVEELEAQITQKKRLVNELCREFHQPVRYPDADAPKVSSSGHFGRDVFYGRPLATVMREVLEARGPSNRGGLGAATVTEIYDALAAGGFKFETKDEANAKRGLRIALAKNTANFHRVGDAYGLAEWYPVAAKAAQRVLDRESRKELDSPELEEEEEEASEGDIELAGGAKSSAA